MNIQWVLSDDLVLDPTIDIKRMKANGAFWGSWRTWRAYNTDNAVCNDATKAKELIAKSFQTICNFYIPNSVYLELDKPKGVKIYDGNFMGHQVSKPDEIISLYLAASVCDIVLLVGFDLASQDETYKGLVKQAIKSKSDVQWILVDHGDIPEEFTELENLDKDTFDNILALLT